MKSITAALLGAMMLTACVQVPLAPDSLRAKTQFADQNVQVNQIVEAVLPDGSRKLAVYGRSLTQFDKIVRYRVRWYDVVNAPINTALDNWLEMNVVANAPFEFVAVSPGKRAVRYVVEFETR